MIQLSWLDYSDRERRKMLDVVRLFEEKDTVDELGLGMIRDGFADYFFPGTGTVQTRARYFFFIPWMYLALEEKRVPSSRIVERARGEEIRLIERFIEKGITESVIGNRSRLKLKRLPSNIYWLGLERLGLRLFSGTQSSYHASLDFHYKTLSECKERSEDDYEMVIRPNWNPVLPKAPTDDPDFPSFDLRRVEAEFFREQLRLHAGGSLFTWLVDCGERTEGVEHIWQHPLFDSIPRHLQTEVRHAMLFSLGMNGAALLYNLMLSESGVKEFQTNGGRWEEGVEYYLDSIVKWQDEVLAHADLFSTWQLPEFWAFVSRCGARVTPGSQTFISAWLEMVRSGVPNNITEHEYLRELIKQRERMLKRGNARLGNRAALENWSGASGAGRLNFRWPSARMILHDIYDGLERKD